MTAKERTQHEISEAFDFIRFLINHPKEIRNIKKGSSINIFCKEIPHKMRTQSARKSAALLQFNYLSERIFRRV